MSFSVDGLVSGLDTTNVIKQLLQVERQPQVRLQSRRSNLEKQITALQGLNTRFATMKSAADALSTAQSWKLFKVTSSDETVATATASSSAQPSSLTFNVTKLAAAHAVVSSTSVASTSTVVASGPLSLTKSDGSVVSVDVGDGTLSAVVSAINRSGAGVQAAAVKVADGAYRLQVTATDTGAASSFTIASTNVVPGTLGTFDVLTAGQDAELSVGDPATTGYTVTSSKNTVTDLLPGLSLTLKKTGTTTVGVASDAGGLADKVQAMVTAANDALAELKKLTAYNVGSKSGGVLLGDSQARRLQSMITDAVLGFGGTSPKAAGIELQRDGTVKFDRAAFLEGYADDPEAIAGLFHRSGSTSVGSLELLRTSDLTRSGSYTVTVTAAATQASATGGATTGGIIQKPETIQIAMAGKTVTYNATAGQSLTSIAAGLEAAFTADGLALHATVEGGRLVLRAQAHGSDGSFEVLQAGAGAKQTGLTLGTYTGTDVVGTFTLADGTVVSATGKGHVLTAPSTEPLGGMAVRVPATTTGVIGTVTIGNGMAQRLDRVATNAVDSASGIITLAVKGRQDQVKRLGRDIEGWDVRLEKREAALRRQFAALETALGSLRSQSTWLAGQLNSLPRYQN